MGVYASFVFSQALTLMYRVQSTPLGISFNAIFIATVCSMQIYTAGVTAVPGGRGGIFQSSPLYPPPADPSHSDRLSLTATLTSQVCRTVTLLLIYDQAMHSFRH